jgi:nucleoside-diphosphate-sugar epimerase
MKIVVTGALGHIGSRLIRELPSAFESAEIVLLDNLSTQRYCSLFDLPADGHYRFIEADVLEANLSSIFTGAQAVVHLAAITNAAGSFEIQNQVEQVNFVGTQKVARACVTTGSALVFLSTTSVYGPQGETVDEECPATDLKPQSPYAASKLRAEQHLQMLGSPDGLRFVICRFGTIFGTSIGMRFHTAINKFCWQAVNGLPLTVWSTALDQRRPYLDLGDGVEAIKFILRHDLFDRRIYNILTINASVRQVVEAVAACVPDVKVEYVDTPIMNQLSYNVLHDRFVKLGFQFTGNLEQRIAETIHLLNGLRRR